MGTSGSAGLLTSDSTIGSVNAPTDLSIAFQQEMDLKFRLF
jgi:hypothetical protein